MNTYTITENGFSMTSNKVCIPHCRIKAESYMDAANKLSEFLKTRKLIPEIELITPMDRIEFDN